MWQGARFFASQGRRVVATSALCGSCSSSGNCAASTQQRSQSTIPNKGIRTQPSVPDRLKDSMSYMGAFPHNAQADEDPPYMNEEARRHGVQELMNNTTNMRSHAKLDRLRLAMDKVRHEGPEHEAWKEVYLFLRTTEMCCELMRANGDVFPKGAPLWIELQSCEERRVPVLMEMENGMIVLPVFSLEEYLVHFYSLTGVYESCWFPVPRMGSRWEAYCELPFPVSCTGTLQEFGTLATVALGGPPVGIVLNPGQRSSKFVTYPEMVEMTKMKSVPIRERNIDLTVTTDEGTTALFDSNLMTAFNTEKMKMKRVEPQELAEKLRQRPPLPPIAQLELHLLLFPYEEIESLYVRTVNRPRWRTLLGGSEKMTQIDVVIANYEPRRDRVRASEIFLHLKNWSFIKEFNSDVHVEVARAAPATAGDGSNNDILVYTAHDGDLLRKMVSSKTGTLADSLGYRDPLVDSKGAKPFEKY